MCLAAGGLALILWRRRTKWALPVLAAGLVYLALFSLNPMVNSVQPWAMRRFVPTVLPILALLTGYTLDTLPTVRWQAQRVAQVLLLAALAVLFLRTDLPFLTYTEYEGMEEQIQRLAERFEENAVILFDQGNPGLYVAQPLTYLHHLNTFVLQRSRPDSSIITPWIKSWQERGIPVYLVLSGDVLDWHPTEWAFAANGTFDLNISRIQRSVSQIPQTIESIQHSLDIYQVLPSQGSQETQPLPNRLDMGAGEYPYLGGGFYGYESTAEGLTYRWTEGLASIQLPRPETVNTTLRLQVAGGRPSGAPEAYLSILVNGTAIASEYLPSGFTFQTLEFSLPSELLETDSQAITVELQSNTWAPLASGYGADSRELGVVVDWIECVPNP